jgi:hypothetical protein
MGRKTIIAFVALLLMAAAAAAQPIVSPERGNPLRAEILNALRPTVEKETEGPVIFVVHALNVMGGWAYTEVTPQRPGGKRVDWRKTKFRDAFEADMFSGLVLALLQKRSGAWAVVDYVVGPTDVYWENWLSKYKLPRDLFRGP